MASNNTVLEENSADNPSAVFVLDHICDSVAMVDSNWRIIYINRAASQAIGKAILDLVGKDFWTELPTLLGTMDEVNFRRAMQDQVFVEFETFFIPTNSWQAVRIYPSPNRITIFSSDITAQKRAEEALRVSEEKFRMLFTHVDQGFCHAEMIFDVEGRPQDYRFLDVNPAFEQMTGLANATGKTALELVPNLERWWIEMYGRVVSTGESARFQHGSDVMGRFFDVFAVSVRENRFVILFTDITERKRYEREREELNIRLRQAMQETHHRVKNNLQVISALVELQVLETESDLTTAPLQRISQHVQALAFIHDLLTEQVKDNGELSYIGAKEVLDKLLPLLSNNIGIRRIDSDIDDIPLTPQKAATLALLVSECVSNSVKHGRGDIRIALNAKNESASLIISDDGAGFPQGFDPSLSARAGLQLIENATRWDMEGEVRFSNGEKGGAIVTVVFPVKAVLS